MITYSKKVNGIITVKQQDNLRHIVEFIEWSLVGEEDGKQSSFGFTTKIPFLSNNDFKPYAELTEEEILSWAELYTSQVDITNAKRNIVQDIENQGRYMRTPLPWHIVNPAEALGLPSEQTN